MGSIGWGGGVGGNGGGGWVILALQYYFFNIPIVMNASLIISRLKINVDLCLIMFQSLVIAA